MRKGTAPPDFRNWTRRTQCLCVLAGMTYTHHPIPTPHGITHILIFTYDFMSILHMNSDQTNHRTFELRLRRRRKSHACAAQRKSPKVQASLHRGSSVAAALLVFGDNNPARDKGVGTLSEANAYSKTPGKRSAHLGFTESNSKIQKGIPEKVVTYERI